MSDRNEFSQLWADSRRVVVLTGAGISTESGIPDFRGPNGVWTRNPAAAAQFDIDSYVSDPQVRRLAWLGRRESPAWTAEPNDGHLALTRLQQTGRLQGLLTQNIDGLHQAAGSVDVVELHGTIWEVVCLSCGRRTPAPEVMARPEADPACLDCGGILKSATISFGQQLDPEVIDRALDLAGNCDLFVAVGTSLQVNPAAGLCGVAVDSGAALAVVNDAPTPYDSVADLIVRDPVGGVLLQVAEDLAPR